MPLLFCAALAALALAQTPRFIPGLFVSSPQGPIELITYAESTGSGKLTLVNGSFEDVPTITPRADLRVLAAVPMWPPRGVIVATQDLCTNDRAELRDLRFATRPLTIAARELRIADLESEASVARLMKGLRASGDNPAYVFIIIGSQGLLRYYPIRLSLSR